MIYPASAVLRYKYILVVYIVYSIYCFESMCQSCCILVPFAHSQLYIMLTCTFPTPHPPQKERKKEKKQIKWKEEREGKIKDMHYALLWGLCTIVIYIYSRTEHPSRSAWAFIYLTLEGDLQGCVIPAKWAKCGPKFSADARPERGKRSRWIVSYVLQV